MKSESVHPVLATLGTLEFHIDFTNSLSISTKQSSGVLIEIAVNLYISLRSITILMQSLLIYEQGMFFQFLDL